METRAKRAVTVLRVVVSLGLVAWVLGRVPVAEVLAALRSADWRLVLLALALIPLGTWASVSRWRLLLRAQGGDAPFSFLLKSFLVGVFFNNLLPGTIGGDAVRAWDTSRAGVGRATAVAVVFVDRFLGLLALMLFAAAGLLVSGHLTERVPALAAWVLGGAVVLLAAAWLLFVRRGRLSALVAFRDVPGRGGVLARAFGWSLLLQALVVLNYSLLARALHVPIPLASFFLIVPLAVFVMMVPVSINAIGVRENVWAFFFAAFGVAGAAASGVAVAWLDYGLVLLQALLGGAVHAWGRGTALPLTPVRTGEGAP